MPRFLVKLEDDLFCEWSTVVDAPVGVWNSLEHLRLNHSHPDDRIEERITRMMNYGTSLMTPCSVEEAVSYNRAGPNETQITIPELIKQLRDALE